MTDTSKYRGISQADYAAFAGPDWPTFECFNQHTNVPEFVYKELDQFLSNHTPLPANSSFCVLPFYGIEYPRKTCCCIMEPADILQIKQQMIDGIRPDACKACWKLEDAGLISDRIIKNATVDYYSKRNLSLLYKDAKENNAKIISYKIDASSTCNSACVTCNGSFSSLWRQLEKDNNAVIYLSSPDITNNQAEELIDFSTATMINFRGGEPLLSKTNFFILEKLIEHNNTQCFISFTTNGSIIPTDKQLEILSKFDQVDFNLSIDGVGPVFEYLRHPLKWASIFDMIEWCRNHNFGLSASYTISNINIMYHNQTVDWFNVNDIKYGTNVVTWPAHFSVSALPENVKKELIQQFPKVESFLSKHTPQDDINFEKCKIEISKQDAWKNINIIDFLPEFVKLSKIK